MPRRKGLGLPPKRRVKLESLEVNHAGIRVSVDPKGHTNGYSGHSSSEEETNKGLVNGDLSKLNSLKSTEENTMENGLPASESEKFLYTHKKFKKMATIAPFNYNVSSPSPPPVKPPPPILLKMLPHPQAAPCSPSPEYLHRHISKLISENQAIVETSDPFLSRKHWQRAKQEKDAPPSPSRIKSVAPRPVHPALPLPPPEWRALMNYPPVPSPQQFSGGYEAAYVKSLMSSPSPSSPLSSASSSSSTEFSWPRKSGAPPPTPQQHPPSPSPWQYEMLLAKQQVESKLATALLRPNASHMSSNPSPDEDQSCQPLNLTVKPAGQVDSKPQRRKRTFNSSFPDEAVERVTFADAGRVSSEAESQPKPKALFTRPEDDSKSQYSNRYQPNATDNAPDGRISRHLNIFDMTQLCKRVRNTSYASQPLVKATGMAVGKSASSPVKVSPPLPSPGPLLGSTPLVDPRSHIPTLRSLEELSRVPMRQHLFQMFGGKVEIRDASGDAKTMRIEPNKSCGDGAGVATTSVVTVAKSSGLNSGGTTILQVPADSPTTHPAGMNLGNDMLIIPVMSKPTTSSAPMGGSASPYNGGVLTLLHAGKAIPHVPGIPGPLSMQQWGEDKGPRGKLSAEVKPIVKNGRVPSLSEPAESTKPGDDHCQALPSSAIHPLTPHLILTSCGTLDSSGGEDDKSSRFLRPTSLPLKPGTYTPKRHLSSPPASQSLVSPETPRPRKGYGQLYLNGHAYTYLGLKCSTRLFFCTLNKPQPLYAPLSPEHAKVSMYSNWKICSEVDPNPFGLSPAQLMTCYSSSPRPAAYTVARARTELLQVTHSSYWSKRRGKKARVPGGGTQERAAKSPLPPALPVPVGALVPEVVLNEEEGSPPHIPEEKPKRRKIFTGGFESNEEYIYIRGRGRGRFVCEECGIRCRKPSMLKKHIRTHSDVRLYACTFCSFSFKTKGNLTKHMKSKAHFKKCVELGVSPMPSSEDLSGDETKDYRNDRSSESMDTEPGESDDDYDDDYDDEDDEIDEEDDDEDDSDDDQKSEDEDRVNSELEHDVAHSLLSLAQMPPQSESSGLPLPLPSARPSTYPYSSSTASTTTVITTLNAMCSTTMITLPSATAVSVLPKVRDSEKAAMSILPPSSPNSTRRQAEFLPPSSGPTPTYVSLLSDGRSMCGICNKIFTKPSQLRLHVNIHYFERPFRCETCAVSFRTKGHLQKHQRSSSHLNKVNMNSTFGAPTTTNPRPFKCDDCKIAFRIHGHLAKHLRSKMHIMKLECGGKLPFGTYAELERCGYNLNDIDTTDCDNSLESLQLLAQKLYEKDPSKLGGWGPDMLSGVGGGGGGALHTSGSGESSDEGESLEPALCAPLLKTEPALSPVRPSA